MSPILLVEQRMGIMGKHSFGWKEWARQGFGSNKNRATIFNY